MPPRSRYAVDPSLSAPAPQTQAQQWQGGPGQSISQSTSPQPQYNQYQQQQPQHDPNYVPQLHQVSDRRTPPPTGEYAPQFHPQQQQQYAQQPQQAQQYQQNQHPSFVPPPNHIPAPPHASGPQMSGPRVRIDPSQVPNPVEAQEMDQNLYDDDDFLSCQPRGVMPLAGTDYRGVDQGQFPSSDTIVYSQNDGSFHKAILYPGIYARHL